MIADWGKQMICPRCHHKNTMEAVNCEYCGKTLPDPFSATHLVLSSERRKADKEIVTGALGDTSPLVGESPFVIYVIDTVDPIVLESSERILLGRVDQHEMHGQAVNLNPYNALKRGVSRLHAVIERINDNVMLIDQASVNGTYLNNVRLAPYDPHIILSGNEIRLGTLVMHCFFNLG